jgi:uncharacterized membrane protein
MRTVWIASAVSCVLLFVLGAIKYAGYRSGSDVGLFVQTMASAAGGFSNTTEGGSHFIFHFSPILYLIAPLVVLTGSPLVLVLASAVAGALVAPPLYLIARRRTSERTAVWVAIAGLLYPPLVGVAFADFHENVLVPALTLWLIAAADARRWLYAAAFALALLCTKEDQALILAFGAVCAIAFYGRRRDLPGMSFSGAIAAGALAVFALYFTVVRPAAGAQTPWGPSHFYDWHRQVKANETAPLFSFGRLTYLLEAFGPLLFISLLSPIAILALPGLVEVLVSHESMTYTMGQHYAAVWIGYVLAAFAFGIGRIGLQAESRAFALARAAAAVCALVLIVASPTHWAHNLRWPGAHDRRLDQAIAELPRSAQVGAPDEIFAHLGFFRRAELGMRGEPEYVLIDSTRTDSQFVQSDLPRVRAAAAAGRYEQVYDRDGIELYRRTDLPS